MELVELLWLTYCDSIAVVDYCLSEYLTLRKNTTKHIKKQNHATFFLNICGVVDVIYVLSLPWLAFVVVSTLDTSNIRELGLMIK